MDHVEISLLAAGIISIIVGIGVIIWSRIIAYIIGGCLVIVGIVAVVAALT